jgi:transposase
MEMAITMTINEQRRARALGRIAEGRWTVEEAARELGLSVRQVWRLRAAERSRGPAGLVHGNRGRASPRRTDDARRARIVGLARDRYRGVNDTQLAELLAEVEGLPIGRETLRALLRAEGIASPRRRRPPRHRSRRERMPALGMLLQLDGSRHDWLQGRGPWLTLVGAVDDATGQLLAATFRDQEDAAGYLEVLRGIVSEHGIPDAIYRDRHSAFEPSRPVRDADPDELDPRLSQVGRALAELEIASIAAASPQAKGRIERTWGTLQDRLVVVLRLAGASDRASANAVLAHYLLRFNERFGVPAAEPAAAWRPVPAGLDLDRVFAFKYRRKVAKDGTITLGGRVLQLPGRGATTYAGRRVEVHVRLDGSMVAFDGERVVAVRAAPPDPVQLRAGNHTRVSPGLVPEHASLPWLPSVDHPWKAPGRGVIRRQHRLTDSLG